MTLASDLDPWSEAVAALPKVTPALYNRLPQYKALPTDAKLERDPHSAQRIDAAAAWLAPADVLTGVLFTFAIPATCLNLFSGDQPFNKNRPDFDRWQHWHRDVLVRALTACHMIGILTRGLVAFHQRITWITDRDSIAANPQRESELRHLFWSVMSLYCPNRPYQLVHVYTPDTYPDTRRAEDLIAVADLANGALTGAYAALTQGEPAVRTPLNAGGEIRTERRDRTILWWWHQDDRPLKRLLYTVTLPNPEAGAHFALVRWRPQPIPSLQDGGDN